MSESFTNLLTVEQAIVFVTILEVSRALRMQIKPFTK